MTPSIIIEMESFLKKNTQEQPFQLIEILSILNGCPTGAQTFLYNFTQFRPPLQR